MVIRDLDVERVIATPFKTDSPLIINSDAMLSCAVTAKFFEPICGWNSQIIKADRIVDHAQFPQSYLLNVRWQPPRTLTMINLVCFRVFESFDHSLII